MQVTYTQLAVPASLTHMQLMEVHDHLGYLTVKKTLGFIKTYFYWHEWI